MIATYDPAFDRINRHRALAEAVIHNRNWLPSWLLVPVVSDFCEQGERYLRGDGLTPLPVRLWWAYRHWRFVRANRMASPNGDRWKRRGPSLDAMQTSNITGTAFKAGGIIPLAPGQTAKFIPVLHDDSHEIVVLDMKSGQRRKVKIDNEMLDNIANPRWHQELPDVPPEMRRAVWFSDDGDFEIDCTTVRDLKRRWVTAQAEPIPTSIGSYPRPNCPKCHTPHPELGTPLDDRTPSGWGDSFYTCTNHNCRHKWKWKKVYPGLEENRNRDGTATGAKLKGTAVPFHLLAQGGLTVEQANAAIKQFGNIAGITGMTPSQRLQLARITQGCDQKTCNEQADSLAMVTDEPNRKNHRQYR